MDADVGLNALIDARMAFLIKGCSCGCLLLLCYGPPRQIKRFLDAALFLTLWDWFTTLNFETLIIWK